MRISPTVTLETPDEPITTDEELWLVQVAIATFHDEYAAQWNYVVAASTVVASPTLILFFLFQQKLIEAIKISALK